MVEITLIVIAGCVFLAILEFFDDKPPMWVVRFRRWMHK